MKAYYDNQGCLPRTELSNMFASNRLVDFARLSESSVSPISTRSTATPPSLPPQQSPIIHQSIKINQINSEKVSNNANKSKNYNKNSNKTATQPKKRYSHKDETNTNKGNSSTSMMPVQMTTSSVTTVTNTITTQSKLSPIVTSHVSYPIVQRDVKPFVNLEEGAITNPITSTYLNMTRSLGLSDDEALKLDQVVSDVDYLHFDISKFL